MWPALNPEAVAYHHSLYMVGGTSALAGAQRGLKISRSCALWLAAASLATPTLLLQAVVHYHVPPMPKCVLLCITLHDVQEPAAPADPYANQPDDYQQGTVPHDPQLVWLEEDLKAFNRKKLPFLIVGFHTPIYNTYIVGCCVSLTHSACCNQGAQVALPHVQLTVMQLLSRPSGLCMKCAGVATAAVTSAKLIHYRTSSLLCRTISRSWSAGDKQWSE